MSNKTPVALFLIFAAAGICQTPASSTVMLSNGVQIDVRSNIGAPTGQQTVTIQMTRASGNSFYRVFRDQNNLSVFAYELVVELVSSGNQLRVIARPCENQFAARFPGADGGKPVPTLSSEQQAGVLASGQSADIPLFELQGVGLKVIDTVRMRLDQKTGAASGRIQFSSLRIVSGDGKTIAGPASGAVSGRYAMFYIPGHGGFFCAIEQPPAEFPFIQAGTIDHNRMKFTIDNVNYEAVASAPIVSNPDTADLWIFHDPSYQPDGNWTQNLRTGAGASAFSAFFTAASDSLDWWLKR